MNGLAVLILACTTSVMVLPWVFFAVVPALNGRSAPAMNRPVRARPRESV